MTDYRWQVETWDQAREGWTRDGSEALSGGIVPRHDGTPADLATRLLRNWTDEPGLSGRWRATIWVSHLGARVGEPVATAELEIPGG